MGQEVFLLLLLYSFQFVSPNPLPLKSEFNQVTSISDDLECKECKLAISSALKIAEDQGPTHDLITSIAVKFCESQKIDDDPVCQGLVDEYEVKSCLREFDKR